MNLHLRIGLLSLLLVGFGIVTLRARRRQRNGSSSAGACMAASALSSRSASALSGAFVSVHDPELPGNPLGTPPQLLQPEYRQELAAGKGMIISLRTVERNDRSPLSGIAAPRSKRASGLRPRYTAGMVLRRRHQPRRPPLAKISPGAMGPNRDPFRRHLRKVTAW